MAGPKNTVESRVTIDTKSGVASLEQLNTAIDKTSRILEQAAQRFKGVFGPGAGRHAGTVRAPVYTSRAVVDPASGQQVLDPAGNPLFEQVRSGSRSVKVESADLIAERERIQAERELEKILAADTKRNRAEERDRVRRERDAVRALQQEARDEQRVAGQRRREAAQGFRRHQRMLDDVSSGMRGLGGVRATFGRYSRQIAGLSGPQGEQLRSVLQEAQASIESGDWRGARDLLALHKEDFTVGGRAAKEARAAAGVSQEEAATAVTGSALDRASTERRNRRLATALGHLDVSEKSPRRHRRAFEILTESRALADAGDYEAASKLLSKNRRRLAKIYEEASDAQKKVNDDTKKLASNYALVAAAGYFGRQLSAGATGFVRDPISGVGEAGLSVVGGAGGALSRYGAGVVTRHGLFSAKGMVGAALGVAGGVVSLGTNVLAALNERGKNLIDTATTRRASLYEALGYVSQGFITDPGFAIEQYSPGAGTGGAGRGWVARPPEMQPRDGVVRYRRLDQISAHPLRNYARSVEEARFLEEAAFRRRSQMFRDSLSGYGIGADSAEITRMLGEYGASGAHALARPGKLGDIGLINLMASARVHGIDNKLVASLMGESFSGRYGLGVPGVLASLPVMALAGAGQLAGIDGNRVIQGFSQNYDLLAKSGLYGGANTMLSAAGFAQNLAAGGISGEGLLRTMAATAGARAEAAGDLFGAFGSIGKAAVMGHLVAKGVSFKNLPTAMADMSDEDVLRSLEQAGLSDLGQFWLTSKGVSGRDSAKAFDRGGGDWWMPDKLPLTTLMDKVSGAVAEANQAKYAELQQHQVANMTRFSEAINEASVAVAKFVKSFSPGYVPGVSD